MSCCVACIETTYTLVAILTISLIFGRHYAISSGLWLPDVGAEENLLLLSLEHQIMVAYKLGLHKTSKQKTQVYEHLFTEKLLFLIFT